MTVFLLTGKPPFWTESQTETYKRIVAADLEFPDHMSEGARDLTMKVGLGDISYVSYMCIMFYAIVYYTLHIYIISLEIRFSFD